jgi:hypothetical protein
VGLHDVWVQGCDGPAIPDVPAVREVTGRCLVVVGLGLAYFALIVAFGMICEGLLLPSFEGHHRDMLKAYSAVMLFIIGPALGVVADAAVRRA